MTATDLTDAVIIEAAINGATPKSRNATVPRTPPEIAEDGLRCLEAGAAIVHNHNDEPVVGDAPEHDPTPYLEAWDVILAERPDALLYPTMPSGGPHTTFERRYAHIPALAEAGVLRIGLVDPGSVNVGGRGPDGRAADIEATYLNTFRDARKMFDTCHRHNLGPSISIFEPGFLRVALAEHEAGSLPPGSLVKFYFGSERTLSGLPPTPAGLEAYLDMLAGTGLPWSAAVRAGDVTACGMSALAISRGGHVRIGLEDYAGPGEPSNVELLQALLDVIEQAGKRPATPDEAAAILGIPAR
ncbi:MAG: 3-keto-5-aminohexanoate cleavage protein [Chloroflexi bacterium]|nr:3-keto-5-aminohexanoate cleavage protein [Chloroflexota bacterium]